MVVNVLGESLSDTAGVVEQALKDVGNLAVSDDNQCLLAAAGACEGE